MTEPIALLLKPRVKALLEQLPNNRCEHWLEELAAATFDLEKWEDVTPEQRRFTKTYFYAFIYGADIHYLNGMLGEFKLVDSMSKMTQAFHQLAAVSPQVDAAIKYWNELMAGSRAPANDHEALIRALEAKATSPLKTDKKRITGQGWSRPRPKGTY